MDDLPLEIGQVHDVEIHDAHGADAGRRQVERQRRPQAARADGEDPSRLEPPLALDSDLGQQQVPGVAQHFRMGELGQLGVDRRPPARDARHDREHVTLAHRGVGGIQLPDVGVVEIQVDEIPQAAVVLNQMALEAAVGRQEPVDHLAHGLAGELDGVAPPSEAPEWCGYGHGHGHGHTSLSTSSDSGRISGCSASSVQLAASAPRPRSTRTIR
jgi:hypothetical protein